MEGVLLMAMSSREKTISRGFRTMCRICCIAAILCPVGAPAQVTHRVLISGCNLGYLAIVGTNGQFEWKNNDGSVACDSWLLPNGNIVYSYSFGAKIIKPNFQNSALDVVVWDHRTKSGGETHSCQPLDGSSSKFLIGESFDTVSYIVEVDTANKEWKRIALPHFGSGAHGQFRQVRKTPEGTYLVSQETTSGRAFEYDSTGKLLRTFPDGRYSAQRLANGNTLIACGDNHRVIEVDRNNQIVWQVAQTDISGISLGFVAEVVRLSNGNTLICNWGGHGGSSGAAVIEVTQDKTLVWSLAATIPNYVASVKVLDTPVPVIITPVLKASRELARQQRGLRLAIGHSLPPEFFTIQGRIYVPPLSHPPAIMAIIP